MLKNCRASYKFIYFESDPRIIKIKKEEEERRVNPANIV